MFIHILAQRRLIPPRTTQSLLVAWQLHSDDKYPGSHYFRPINSLVRIILFLNIGSFADQTNKIDDI